MSRLYVGNLGHGTTEADLRAAFSGFGEVSSVKIAIDRRGRTRGFAYVDMADSDAVRRAMESQRGTQINGRTLDVVEETQRRGRGSGFRSRRRR